MSNLTRSIVAALCLMALSSTGYSVSIELSSTFFINAEFGIHHNPDLVTVSGVGAITCSGTFGGVFWTVNVTEGTNDPATGLHPYFVSVSSGGGGTLYMLLSERGFHEFPPLMRFDTKIEGTTDGSIGSLVPKPA